MPQSSLPQHASQQQGGVVAQAQITPADSKVVKQRRPAGTQQENKVCQMGVPAAGRPESAVKDPQRQSQKKPQPEPLGGKRRGCHPNSRRSRLPERGCS